MDLHETTELKPGKSEGIDGTPDELLESVGTKTLQELFEISNVICKETDTTRNYNSNN